MEAEVGSIVEGKVSGITNFGVFVRIEENVTGMVHISEVARTYVKDIKDFVQIGDTVKVKILAISPEGKISLSMKQTEEPEKRERHPKREQHLTEHKTADSFEFHPKQKENLSFEDMMSQFKQSSDEKMGDLKKVIDTRRGAQNRRSKQS